MPSSVANYEITNDEHKPDKQHPDGTGINLTATDLHFTGDGDQTHKIISVGPAIASGGAAQPLVPPTDPNATYNVAGQDTKGIDITNISVPVGSTITIRVESHSLNGAVPKLKVHWTYRNQDHPSRDFDRAAVGQ